MLAVPFIIMFIFKQKIIDKSIKLKIIIKIINTLWNDYKIIIILLTVCKDVGKSFFKLLTIIFCILQL